MKHINILITLCAIIFAQTAFAANIVTTVTLDEITYDLYDDNTATVTGASQEIIGAVILPSTIEYNGHNYTLTRINDDAFQGNSLNSVTIPNSVSSIGNEAFLNCQSLISVTIPNSVSTIGRYAFKDCLYLRSLTIGAFVQYIGDNAFSNCINLETVIFYPTKEPVQGNNILSNIPKINKIYCCNTENYMSTVDNPIYLRSFTNFEINDYLSSVKEAIDISANKVALSDDEKTKINGYKSSISENNDVQQNELAAHRIIAIAGIRSALPSEEWTEAELAVLNGKFEAINTAATLAAIYTLQKEVLEWIAFHPNRVSALAEIETAMQGNTNSAYLNNLIKEQVDAINSTTDIATINSNKKQAIDKLNIVVPAIEETKAAIPGEGTTGNGVRLIKDEKTLELFNLDKVEFFKK